MTRPASDLHEPLYCWSFNLSMCKWWQGKFTNRSTHFKEDKEMRLTKVWMMVFIAAALWITPALAVPIVMSDFHDGTLQGWNPKLPFNGNLFADPAAGNPGGAMVATDTVGGVGGLLASAPAPFLGDLTSFAGIQISAPAQSDLTAPAEPAGQRGYVQPRWIGKCREAWEIAARNQVCRKYARP